jgi:hypothetical protein
MARGQRSAVGAEKRGKVEREREREGASERVGV